MEHAQSLHGSQPDVPGPRWDVHASTSPTQWSPIDNHSQRKKKSVFSNRVALNLWATLKGRPAQQQMANAEQTLEFSELLSHNVFVWAFFYLPCLSPCLSWFSTLCFLRDFLCVFLRANMFLVLFPPLLFSPLFYLILVCFCCFLFCLSIF